MINCCEGYNRNDMHQLLCQVCKRLAKTMPAGQVKHSPPSKVKNLCVDFWLHNKKLRRGFPFKAKWQVERYQYALKHDLVPKDSYDLNFLKHLNMEDIDYEASLAYSIDSELLALQ